MLGDGDNVMAGMFQHSPQPAVPRGPRTLSSSDHNHGVRFKRLLQAFAPISTQPNIEMNLDSLAARKLLERSRPELRINSWTLDGKRVWNHLCNKNPNVRSELAGEIHRL